MKKTVLFIAAAAALAACSKNEVMPAGVAGDAEITWLTAPKSKAIADRDSRKDFSHDNVFASYAYALGAGKTWSADYASAAEYVPGVTISYMNDVWKNADTKYFWPKEGSLTFFAWSINENNLNAYKNAVSCTPADGIKADLDVVANKNVDFLVADMQADKNANEKLYDHNGVPTLFRHKLSYVVFKVRTDKDYSEMKTITLKSIKFTGASSKGAYSQLAEGAVFEKIADSDAADQTYSAADQVVLGGEYQDVASVDQYLYMPQTFTENGAELNIVYTVTTKKEYTGGQNDYEETLNYTVDVKNLFASWEMGKRYTFNLTFSLDEILWDPAVENWTDVNGGEIIIEQ